MEKRKGIQLVSETLRILLTAAAVLSLLCLLVKVCNFLVTDDANSYTRLTMHEFYESEEPIETLFLGTSHCYRAYDPEAYEKLTGESAFNLGSSSQNIDTSYYLLREALRYQKIQKVYLDIYHVFLFFNPDNRELVEANIISDYMRPSLNKLEFILRRSSSEHYTNSFFPFRRDWQKLGDFEYLKENIKKKQTESYQSFAPVVYEDEQYVGKGFVASKAVLHPENYQWIPRSEKEDLSGDVSFALSYLDKIVDLCRKENIELIFLTAPSYEKYVESIDSYEAVHDFVQKIADERQIPYWDFNLMTEEMPELGTEDFMDEDHLNGNGAGKVTAYLAELVLKNK